MSGGRLSDLPAPEEDGLETPRHAPLYMPQPEPLDPLPMTGGMFSPFAGSGLADIPASCGPPYVSYPGPPAASPVVTAAPLFEPALRYQAPNSLEAAVAQGGANQFRIFTSEE